MVESGSSPRPKIPDLHSETGVQRGSNVTLRSREPQGYFACPTCKKLRPVGLTKKKEPKPYFTCNDCGVQVFFRGKEGIRRFREMLGHAQLAGNVRGLAPLLEYAAFLRKRLRQIRREKPILGKDSNLEIEEKLVENEIARVRNVLEIELKDARRQLRGFDRNGDD